MYEVFDPRDGKAIYTVPFKWLAKLIARKELDYAKKDEGWV